MSFHGTVTGQVERIINTDRATGVVVKYTEEGAQYPDRVTVWLRGSDDVPEVGWGVTYEGDIRARLSKPNAEGKQYVNVSLNNPRTVQSVPVVDTYVPNDDEVF